MNSLEKEPPTFRRTSKLKRSKFYNYLQTADTSRRAGRGVVSPYGTIEVDLSNVSPESIDSKDKTWYSSMKRSNTVNKSHIRVKFVIEAMVGMAEVKFRGRE